MALYISTQNGKWDDPATWGGGGYPHSDGDTVEVHHVVEYDYVLSGPRVFDWVKVIGNPSPELESELWFTPDMSTLLQVRGSPTTAGISLIPTGSRRPKLTINNNTPGNIDRDYIVDIQHAGNTADKFIDIDPTCQVQMEGLEIPEYGLLLEDVAGGSDTIHVTPDKTGKWLIGDTLYFHQADAWGSHTILKRNITNINEYPTYTEVKLDSGVGSALTTGAKVVNMAKSIKLSNTVTGQCGLISIASGNDSGTSLINGVQMEKVNIVSQSKGVKFTHVTSWKAVDHQGFLWFTNSAFFESTFLHVYDSDLLDTIFFGLTTGSLIRDSSGLTLSGDIFCNNDAIAQCDAMLIMADLDFNYRAIYDCYNVELRSQRSYANDWALHTVANVRIYDSQFGRSNVDTDLQNDVDMEGSVLDNIVLKNVRKPTAGWSINMATGQHSLASIGFENQDGLDGYQELRCYEGTIIKRPAEGLDPLIRRGGSATAAYCTSNSNTDRRRPLKIFEYDIECQANVERTFVCYVIAGETWSADLKGADDPAVLPEDATLWLEAECYGSPTDFTHERRYSVEKVPNTTPIQNYWRGTPLTVTVEPKRAGAVRISLKLGLYKAGCYIIVDPRILIS